MTDRALTEAIVVAEFWANRRGESIRVQLREFEGIAIIDVRKHYTASDGVLRPTKKGLSLAIRRLPDLAAAIAKALEKARELGLIKPVVGDAPSVERQARELGLIREERRE